jgi:uncharacterized membrane protein
VEARLRLAIALACGIVAAVPIFLLTEWQVAALAGWDITAVVFMGFIAVATRGKDSAGTKAMATREDDSRSASEAVLVGASIFSLVGVAFALIAAGGTNGLTKSAISGLVVLSVLVSWASVHAVFTLRYARIYYRDGGGIDFHSEGVPPDFGDFLYVALTIGMTFQVSDTDLNSKAIRMTALRHSLLSYLFGVVVFATTINVIATLLSK